MLLHSFGITFIAGDSSVDKRGGGAQISFILTRLFFLWGAL